MLELTEAKVARWGRVIAAPSARLAEHDHRLVELLRALNENAFLRDAVAFKGGTALNKLYFGELSRLSVDLDFNALGTKEAVQGQAMRQRLRAELEGLLKAQDPAFSLDFTQTWEMLRVTGRYQPLAGGGTEKIKLEVSMVERFPLTRIIERPLALPDDGTAGIRTYPLDELVATKLRAFRGRRKGRDVFDLESAAGLVERPAMVRKMAEYYFYRGRAVFDPEDIRRACAVGLEPEYRRDLAPYLRTEGPFDLKAVLAAMPERYAFLFELDERDREFLILAAHLLGHLGARRAGAVLAVERPLQRLFEGQEGLSQAGRDATIEDLRLHE